MCTLQLSIDTSSFFTNFLSLRDFWEDDIPHDVLTFFCSDCEQNICLNPTGLFILKDTVEEPFKDFFTMLQAFAMEEHITYSNTCGGENIQLTTHGTPTNLVFLTPETEIQYLTDIFIDEKKYILDLVIKSKENESKAVLLCYKVEESESHLYLDFIKDNFQNHLDVDVDMQHISLSAENLIIDDDSANEYRHLVPRIDGGGRKLNQHFNYSCMWCPKESMRGQRGKFILLKNYRDHFRRVHADVPFSEFLDKVNKREPKWLCPNCQNQMSIGNIVRHKAICRLSSSEEEEEEEEEEEGEEEEEEEEEGGVEEEGEDQEEVTEVQERRKRNVITHKKTPTPTTVESDNNEENQPSASTQTPAKKHNVFDFSDEEENTDTVTNVELTATKRILEKGKLKQLHKSSEITDTVHDEIDASPVLRKRFKKTSEGKYRIVDEINNNDSINFKKPQMYKVPEDSIMKSDDSNTDSENETSVNTSVIDTGNWWQDIHEGLFCDNGYNGMKIFYKTDSRDFVEKVIQNWKMHEAKKCLLDKKREDIENSDLALNQFSHIRDQPILNAYSDFVQSHSTKDVLQIFSADYDENSVQMGAKASTAKNYEKRILELFKFMSEQYEGFHLDWFLDFSGKIEKTTVNGEKSHEIFIPSKDDLTNFVKLYKYGTNPAANVGIRIFAVKKFLEFLIKQYEHNEQSFPGSIVEKSTLVESLVKNLNNLNKAIVPDGTIKKLSIASNKNHRQALMEQTARCPEKSIKKIMEGVSSYLSSSEYSDMKTMLLELAYKKTKIATRQEYMLVTNWLLEMLICLGGNRPCALLGITIGNDNIIFFTNPT